MCLPSVHTFSEMKLSGCTSLLMDGIQSVVCTILKRPAGRGDVIKPKFKLHVSLCQVLHIRLPGRPLTRCHSCHVQLDREWDTFVAHPCLYRWFWVHTKAARNVVVEYYIYDIQEPHPTLRWEWLSKIVTRCQTLKRTLVKDSRSS